MTSGSRRVLGPPVTETHAAAEFAVSGGLNAPAQARSMLAEQVDGAVRAEALDTVLVLLSEVVTNCVVHGGASDGRPITVATSRRPDQTRVKVSSVGPAFDYEPYEPGGNPADSRGLYLVDALATAWGIMRGPPPSVWFEVANPRGAAAFA